jgi:glucose-6-phosphate isomerase
MFFLIIFYAISESLDCSQLKQGIKMSELLTSMNEWKALQHHYEALKEKRIKSSFMPAPAIKHSITNAVSVDFSRNFFTDKTLDLLFNFAEKSHITSFIRSLISHNKLNITEDRAVYHQALRFPGTIIESLFGSQIKKEILSGLSNIKKISQEVRGGFYNGVKIRHILNLGVGGSDLGSRMVTSALKDYCHPDISIDFISNLDPSELNSVLSKLNPCETLVVISSKSFTTYETLFNAKLVFGWMGEERAISQSIAITVNKKKAISFGIKEENILPLWEWVGGRYSIWSTMGLIVSIAIGYESFESFLQGAYEVDTHLQTVPLRDNLPLTLALIDCWNINFIGALTRAVIPYATKLNYFIPYLQQLIMESNGKSTDIHGNQIDYHTGPIIWGGIGCDSQHAFHQLLMQGTQLVPVDFISIKNAFHIKDQSQQNKLNHQLKAQSEALFYGNSHKKICNHRLVRGNIPHNIFTLDFLSPYSLGTLLAIFEYRTILSAYLWRINPFDQFGVELGKELAIQNVLDEVMEFDNSY